MTNKCKNSAKTRILKVLFYNGWKMSVEIKRELEKEGYYTLDKTISRRCNELVKDGKAQVRNRQGKKYHEWDLTPETRASLALQIEAGQVSIMERIRKFFRG